MKTFELAPFYRSTVGFDRLFDLVENNVRSDWPPYDIEKTGEDAYRISMAIAGFTSEEVEMTQRGTSLIVSGRKSEAEGRQLLHRGIAGRSFKQTFNLADHVKVSGATLENGLLAIDLVPEVPEAMRPRRIDIAKVQNDVAPRIDGAANDDAQRAA